MKGNRKRFAVAFLPLFLLGMLLLSLPQVVGPQLQSTDRYLSPPLTISLDWQPMPTRARPPSSPTPEPVPPEERLLVLTDLLRQGRYVAATSIWSQLITELPNDGAVVREGARLAWALGDLTTAERRIWTAIGINPSDPESWEILSMLLTQGGEHRAAQQALNMAVELRTDADRSGTFTLRWQLARRTSDTQAMQDLADWYSLAYPADSLRAYYRAAALIATHRYNDAIELLAGLLKIESSGPAALWYALGQAYLGRGAYWEAARALEVAASKKELGDPSITLASDDPDQDLRLSLGRAYVGSGRCAQAEAVLSPSAETNATARSWLERAVLCQTPTPTMTPWILSQQSTPTRSP